MDTILITLPLLGICALAGVRPYATLLVICLMARYMGPLPQLPSGFPGGWVLLVLLGVAALLEFMADKLAFIDTLWDALHTPIRPLFGILLGGLVGYGNGYLVMAMFAILGGLMSLTTHLAKSSWRFSMRFTPEPCSPVAVSFAEDAVVLCGVWAALFQPLLSLMWSVLLLVLAIVYCDRLLVAFRLNCRRMLGCTPPRS
jgi:Domain of unknown function (DUF4126)